MTLLQRPLATLLLLCLFAAGVLHLQAPPAPVPASVPADRFSAERAMGHVRDIARAHHPLGTPEHDRVRDHLVLRQLGFATTVQTRLAQRAHGQDLVMAGLPRPGSRLTVDLILPGIPPGTAGRPKGLIPAPVDPYTDSRILRQTLAF